MREVCMEQLKERSKKRVGKINIQEFIALQRIRLLTLKVQKHQQGTGYFYHVWLGIATDLICMIYEGVNKTSTLLQNAVSFARGSLKSHNIKYMCIQYKHR